MKKLKLVTNPHPRPNYEVGVGWPYRGEWSAKVELSNGQTLYLAYGGQAQHKAFWIGCPEFSGGGYYCCGQFPVRDDPYTRMSLGIRCGDDEYREAVALLLTAAELLSPPQEEIGAPHT